jgi:Carboxypeptidase regulatory-like domain/TonB dependent receptor
MRRRASAAGARRTFVLGATLIALLAAGGAPTLEAQVLYGSIVGSVKDSTGAAVPGAGVTITNVETRLSRQALAEANGAYTFSTVPTGTYVLKVSLSGFKTFTQPAVPVTLNSVTRIDATLQVGAVSESVEVTAERPLLQADRAEVRIDLDRRELRDLPVPLGRNYQQLFKTLPGFTPPQDAHSVPSNPSRSLVFNVNGASRSSNNTRIDGVSSTNVWLPHVSAYVPALESIETVNVVTNSFDAEQGLAGGSAINVQIKSGTNEFHGALFEYHHNQHLRARDFFLPPEKAKGKYVYNQYGGTLGGPLLKNKLFFFASYEGTKDRQNVNQIVSVPTEALRRGDFSASLNPIYDPRTGNPDGSGRTPFPGNVIPPSRIDPIVGKILPLIPLPNLQNPDGTTPELNNYFVSAPFLFDRWTLDTKINWNATPKFTVFGRYSLLDFYTFKETVFGPQLQGPPIGGGNPGTGEGKTHNFSVGATYAATPSFVVDANFGFVRMNTGVEHSDIDKNVGRDLLGIPGTNGTRRFEGGFPRFNISNYTPYGVSETYMPYYRSDDQYQYVLNATWIRGKHNIRFGSDVYYQALNHTQPEFTGTSQGARGGFTFGSGPTQVRGGPTGTSFNSFAAFLLGFPTEAGRLLQTDDVYTTRNWQYSLYVRDQWQVSSKLTLSLGTRWEYFPVPTRKDRGLERYDIETNRMEIGGVGSVPRDLGVKVSKTLFAPRVGVAYRPTHKSVIRAGFGITNDPYALARPLRTNHPVLLNLNVLAPNSLGYASPLAAGIPEIVPPSLGNGIIEVPGNVSVITLPDEFDRGYVKSWNLTFQRELPLGFVGEIGYVGTRQVRQLGFVELNWSPVGGGRTGRALFAKFGRDAQTRMVAPIGDSKYDSLQARLERRFSKGVQLAVYYTLSRSRGIAGADNSDGIARIKIPEFYDLNRALSGFDRTHNLQVTNLTELPFGRDKRWLDKGGFAAAVLGGWQVNNILSFYTGTPFSVTASGTSLNAPDNDQRADVVKAKPEILGGIGRGHPYFDPFAFAPVTEARFGTADFNLLHGPGYANWDMGLFRQFGLRDKVNLQLRVEVFNVTNTPHFENPGDTSSNNNVSNMQLNPDGSIRSLNGYAEVSRSYGERQIRVGLRLGF